MEYPWKVTGVMTVFSKWHLEIFFGCLPFGRCFYWPMPRRSGVSLALPLLFSAFGISRLEANFGFEGLMAPISENKGFSGFLQALRVLSGSHQELGGHYRRLWVVSGLFEDGHTSGWY
jgi:hypothetical protein